MAGMVMNKGVAEQIGTPVDVYERPASRFVASFIGSPAMNLLEGKVSIDGWRFELEGGDPGYPPGTYCAKLTGRRRAARCG